jgi:hypothetical protein
VLRYYICSMHAFLYTNEFKDFTLETAARNPPAGARQTRLQIARLISLLLLLLLLLWLEEFDLVERGEARVDINELASRVATRHGCPETGLPDEMSG